MKLNDAFLAFLGLRNHRKQQEGLGAHEVLARDMLDLQMCSPLVFSAVREELRDLGVTAASMPGLHAQVYHLLGTAIRDGHAARLKHLEFMCGFVEVLSPAIGSVRAHFKVQGDAQGTEWTDRVASEIRHLSTGKYSERPSRLSNLVAGPTNAVSVL